VVAVLVVIVVVGLVRLEPLLWVAVVAVAVQVR
jgi:hypothetical protein